VIGIVEQIYFEKQSFPLGYKCVYMVWTIIRLKYNLIIFHEEELSFHAYQFCHQCVCLDHQLINRHVLSI
jgi:hypothetical protein